MTRHSPHLITELKATLDWWRAAGVDCDFHDDVTGLLSEPAPSAAPGASPIEARFATKGAERGVAANEPNGPTERVPPSLSASARPDLLGDSPPQDLSVFRDWWMQAAGLDTGGLYPRVPPRGVTSAALMVLVPQPEEHDTDRLLNSAQGRLLNNIISAMGYSEAEVYIAAALPSHTPMADFAAIAARGMDRVMLHHIALAVPQRLLVFGSGIGPILNTEKIQPLREINYGPGKVPVMVSETLEAMLDMPRLKARFWRRWMEWSATQ